MKIAMTALFALIFAQCQFSFADDPPATTSPSDGIRVVPDIECGTGASLETVAPNHVAISITADTEDWWMFKLQGVAGKTLTIDLKMAPHDIHKWVSLTPVYSEAADLDDPATFATGPTDAELSNRTVAASKSRVQWAKPGILSTGPISWTTRISR